ncbi:zinc metallopeptidase [Anaeromicropila populeti]
MRMFYYWDPTYILILIGALLSLGASAMVRSTYGKYSRVRNIAGLTGAQAAERILRNAGIYDVRIERVSGDLTDHYDPRNKVLRLSDTVYGSASIAAVGVAAHECGHAVQHDKSYVPLTIRSTIVPVVQFGSFLSWPLIILGFMLRGQLLITLGIVLFSAVVAFQIITLPVELNASRRALVLLEQGGILYRDEVNQAKKVLNAAALTYVAAAAASILQLLRLIILFGGRGRDD